MAGNVFDQATGETVCRRCGAVMDSTTTPSLSQVGFEDQNTPTPREELGGHMGSVSGSSRDASGRVVEDVYGVRRQRAWQRRTAARASGPDSIRVGDTVVNTLADKLSLPDNVRRDAASLCARACRLGLSRGRTVGAVAAASILLAVRLAGIPKSSTEIEEAANIHRLPTHYRMLCNSLGISPPPPKLEAYVTRMASTMNLPAAISKAALSLLDKAGQLGKTGGRSPTVIAAAAISLAAAKSESHKHLTMEAVAKAAGASAPGVRQCAAMLRPIMAKKVTV